MKNRFFFFFKNIIKRIKKISKLTNRFIFRKKWDIVTIKEITVNPKNISIKKLFSVFNLINDP